MPYMSNESLRVLGSNQSVQERAALSEGIAEILDKQQRPLIKEISSKTTNLQNK